jgi:hypothetical protein
VRRRVVPDAPVVQFGAIDKPQSTQAPISRYPVPALGSMPEDIRARILKVQEKSGPKAAAAPMSHLSSAMARQ